ncbi:sodium/hydrogen exchanger 9B2-like isoform X3 [Macrosteles quadrilineatus]|uniref:sodium/hydrogen exchanger 9B2-like isoform X3 n=1 Tax=Macrosteles quadrilineatus TaxID=74068 RepID=UPI0023E12329|nr:sodium/hydrogen exchanger 9B2-like isoform X3 [Macrosteles quadrilineatus]
MIKMTAVDDSREAHGTLNTGFTHDEPRRKVSISMDAVHADEERKRKISTGSHLGKNLGLHNGDHSHFVEHSNTSSNTGQLNLDHIHQQYNARTEASWWYLLCAKCRQKETGPGWEPSFWQMFCPYPFCPTYRHVARCFALFLLVMLAWGVVYSVMGSDAAPGGPLFAMAMLVISAHFGGYFFRLINLPGLAGMLAVGVIYQNMGLVDIHGPYLKVSSVLRRIALVLILTKAGLDLDPGAMKRLFGTILRLGLVPWCVEAGIVYLACHFILGLPGMWALLTGVVVAAVSPAVVVPCLFRIRSKGYGVAKGIPTVVIAVSGIDDAASVAAFGILQGLMFSEHSAMYNVILGMASVFCGVGFGIFWGLLLKYIPEKGDPFVVPMRILLLLCGGLISVFGSELIELEGAGPLAVVAASFIASWIWSTQGWHIEDNPVVTAFDIFWMVFEPILFSLTGTQIRIREIDTHIFIIATATLAASCILRQMATVVVAFGTNLNFKEKIFVALSWMAKASVQAALAPVALSMVVEMGKKPGSEEYESAKVMLMFCVLSIALTAPLGAILIMLTGTKLLTKTVAGPPAGWRHSARPSLRDITVIDQGNDEDDIERRSMSSRHHSPHAVRRPVPNLVVTHQP